MATQRISIMQNVLPDSSGEVYPSSSAGHQSNAVLSPAVMVMEDGSTRTGFFGSFQVPENYVDSAVIGCKWLTEATSGDWEFDFDYAAVAVGETFDPAAATESVNVNDTAPGTARLLQEATIALTDGNFAAEDQVSFFFARDKSDAGDTISDEVLIVDVFFEYADA